MNQTDIFLRGEGDQWYLRNRAHLEENEKAGQDADEISWLCAQLQPFAAQMRSALEIGCSNGAKLRQICRTLNLRGDGLDPSRQAVDDGNLHPGNVSLQVGSAASLPFPNASFDVVYFGFCLYLMAREDIFMVAAEADRVLRHGGFLAITDFDPAREHKRPYSHMPGVYSYKQDYSRLFLQGGQYALIAKRSFSHRQTFFDVDTDERVSTAILYKEPEVI